MRIDPVAILAIEEKLARANQHLSELYDEMLDWDRRVPWRLVPEVHGGGSKHFYRLRFLESIPVRWSVIVGEAIHDIRSALDQAVYWLGVDWTGREVSGSQFPVYRRRANFLQKDRRGNWSFSGGMFKIRGIGPGPQEFIESLQPYPQRDKWFYCRDLRTIHDLWNQDKHRLVHLWGLRFDMSDLLLPATIVSDCVIGPDRRVLREGQIVVRVTCDPPHADVTIKGRIAADLTFASGKRRPGGANDSLWHTLGTGADVVRKLINAIGRQDEPITRDVWTARQRASELRAAGFP